jgi:hypothetical protein
MGMMVMSGSRELRILDAAGLAAAYAMAEYAVLLDGDALRLSVGRHADDLEAYWPAQRYGFITAWNPRSAPQSDAANETATAALTARLDAIGAARHPAHAFDKDGQWREAGWLVANMEPGLLDLLAREFGQAGVLSWASGEPVRLRMLMPKPVGNELAHVDWAEP